MSTQVDDLKIKLEGDVKSAEGQIDKIISKLGQLESKISSIGKDNGIAKSFSNASDGIKKGIADLDKCVGRINEIRKQVGDIGKDYADKGGSNLKTVAQIQKAIDNATAQMYKHKENAALAGENTKGFDSNITQAIKLENHIASLQAKLNSINTETAQSETERWQSKVDAIDNAIARMLSKEQAGQDAVANSAAKITDETEGNYQAYHGVNEEVERLMQNMYGVGSAAQSTANKFGEIQNSANGVTTATESVDQKFSMIGATVDAFKTKLENLPYFLEKLNVTKPSKVFTDTLADIDKVEAELEKLQYQMDRGLATNTKFTSTTTFNKLKFDIQSAEGELDRLYSKLDEMEGHTHVVNWDMIGAKMKDAFGTTVGVVKNLTTHVFNLANSLNKRIVGSFANLAKNLNKTDDVAKKLFKSFTKVSNMLKLMITRMALRGVINEAKQGFQDLITFSDKTANSYNKIRNAIKYLADSLAALTAPILNASTTFAGLGNIIDFLADKIVDLVNKINQLTSALLGHSTWIKATKQTNDYANAATGAAKAAKKALQPFDELNNLTTNDNNGGSGGASGGGAQYQELPIDEKWTDIAKWLKDQWEKSDFTQLGQVLGEKMRDALNNIPWDSLKETAAKVGKSLGTLINGFVETPGLPEAIGKAIGEALNTVVTGISNFVDATHFESIGRFIGVSIINAVKTINWAQLKSTAGDIGSSVAKGINSFFDTGVLESIGKAVGETITAGINLWYNFVTELDFSMIGKRISEGLNSFLNSMSSKEFDGLSGWQKLGTAISTSITGFLKTANIVLGDAETREKIANAISEFIDSISWEDIYNGIKELGGNIIKAVETIIKGIFSSEKFKTEGVGVTIDAGLMGISVVGGVALAKTIGTAISTAIGGSVGVQVALVVAIGAITWKIGNKIYSALDQQAFDMSIGQQVSYIANTTIGEATYAIKMMFYDPDGNPLTQFGNNTLLNMLPGGGVADFIVNLKAGTFDSSLQWIKDNNPISKTVNVIKGSIDAAVSALASGNSATSLTVSVIEAVKGAAQALYNLISGIVNFCKNPVSFTLKMVGTETAAEKLPIIGTALKSINNIKGKGKNGAITKKATFSLKSEVTENGQSTKLSALTKVGASIKSLATSWGLLKTKGGTANLTANASWANGTKESLEDQLNKQNLTCKVYAEFENMSDKEYTARVQHKAVAKGGLFSGGKWHPITNYASGGQPKSAEMFIAREAGPELVGRLGSNTAVMNNDQIVASVSNGVYKAVVAAMSNVQIGGDVNVEITGEIAPLFRAIRKEGNNYQRRTGNPVFA